MSNNNGTTAAPPDNNSRDSQPPSPSTAPANSSPAPPPQSSNSPSQQQPAPSSNAPPPTNQPGSPELQTSIVTLGPSSQPQQTVVLVTSSIPPTTPPPASTSATVQATSASTSTTASATPTNQPAPAGVPQTTVIAVAVVVPLVAVALLVLAGIFAWRKRKQRKNNAEMRKAEINDYNYNPNSEPPSGGMGSESGTMKENAAGYRGWGTTSTTRKLSNSVSSPPSGMGRSNSGNNGPLSAASGVEGHAGEPLATAGSPTAEPIGALGAAPVAGTRAAGINRGPSNASSAYSGANRSEVSALSGEGTPQNHVGSPQYYADAAYPEDGANADGAYSSHPVIQDVSARRNTRIENPSVFPQQGNAGISQNF